MDLAAVRDLGRGGGRRAGVVKIKGDGPGARCGGVRCPLGVKGGIPAHRIGVKVPGDGAARLLVPACKGVTGPLGVGDGSGDLLTVTHGGLRYDSGGSGAVEVEKNTVEDGRPLGVENGIPRYRIDVKVPGGGAGRLPIPPCKGVAGHIGGGGLLCLIAVGNTLAFHRTATSGVKGDGVERGRSAGPVGVDGGVRGEDGVMIHLLAAVGGGIPAGEVVARKGGGGHGYGSAAVGFPGGLGDGTAAGIKGDSIELVPLGVKSDVGGHAVVWERPFIFAVRVLVPAHERKALPLGTRGLWRDFVALGNGLRGDLGAFAGLIGDSVVGLLPLRVDPRGVIGHRIGCKIPQRGIAGILVPIHKGIAHHVGVFGPFQKSTVGHLLRILRGAADVAFHEVDKVFLQLPVGIERGVVGEFETRLPLLAALRLCEPAEKIVALVGGIGPAAGDLGEGGIVGDPGDPYARAVVIVEDNGVAQLFKIILSGVLHPQPRGGILACRTVVDGIAEHHRFKGGDLSFVHIGIGPAPVVATAGLIHHEHLSGRDLLVKAAHGSLTAGPDGDCGSFRSLGGVNQLEKAAPHEDAHAAPGADIAAGII